MMFKLSSVDLLLNGYRASVWDDDKILDMDGGDGCTMSEENLT